ncbi:hypothetical protein E1871_19480 [Salmonella enterica subsp. enterica serovar Mgulani]|nr:hypothetical protein [Salmonella enterica subsp. enterica serovar Mgulani]
MTKKFEEIPADVQESILRTIEWRLTHGCSNNSERDVDEIMSAYRRLFQSSSTTKVGEIVVNVTTVHESS